MEHLSKDQINHLIEEIPEKRIEWMEHINGCKACRMEYESELAIHKSLKGLNYHQPSMRFAKNIIELIEKSKKLDRATLFWTKFMKSAILIAFVQSIVMLVCLFVETSEDFFLEVEMERIFWWNIVILGTSVSFWFLYFFDRRLKNSSKVRS